MARVTVEDCLEKVENRFALTVLASRRARQLSEGRGTPLVQCSNKAGVTALREVGSGGVRFAEDVENTMREFIEEQRRDLQSLSFTDDVDFGPGSFGDPDADGEDYDDDIEELVPDLTRVKPENRNDADDDDNPKNTMDSVNQSSSDDDDGESGDDDGEDGDDNGEDFEDGEDIDLPDLSDDGDGDGAVKFDDDDDDDDKAEASEGDASDDEKKS